MPRRKQSALVDTNIVPFKRGDPVTTDRPATEQRVINAVLAGGEPDSADLRCLPAAKRAFMAARLVNFEPGMNVRKIPPGIRTAKQMARVLRIWVGTIAAAQTIERQGTVKERADAERGAIGVARLARQIRAGVSRGERAEERGIPSVKRGKRAAQLA